MEIIVECHTTRSRQLCNEHTASDWELGIQRDKNLTNNFRLYFCIFCSDDPEWSLEFIIKTSYFIVSVSVYCGSSLSVNRNRVSAVFFSLISSEYTIHISLLRLSTFYAVFFTVDLLRPQYMCCRMASAQRRLKLCEIVYILSSCSWFSLSTAENVWSRWLVCQVHVKKNNWASREVKPKSKRKKRQTKTRSWHR